METKAQVRIKVNAEGNKAIQELLDIALKQGGLQAINGVSQLLNSIDIDQEYFEKVDAEVKKKAEAQKEVEKPKK